MTGASIALMISTPAGAPVDLDQGRHPHGNLRGAVGSVNFHLVAQPTSGEPKGAKGIYIISGSSFTPQT